MSKQTLKHRRGLKEIWIRESPNALELLNELSPASKYEVKPQNGRVACFEAVVTVNGKTFIGHGSSKKKAKHCAAEQALGSFVQYYFLRPNQFVRLASPPAVIERVGASPGIEITRGRHDEIDNIINELGAIHTEGLPDFEISTPILPPNLQPLQQTDAYSNGETFQVPVTETTVKGVGAKAVDSLTSNGFNMSINPPAAAGNLPLYGQLVEGSLNTRYPPTNEFPLWPYFRHWQIQPQTPTHTPAVDPIRQVQTPAQTPAINSARQVQIEIWRQTIANYQQSK